MKSSLKHFISWKTNNWQKKSNVKKWSNSVCHDETQGCDHLKYFSLLSYECYLKQWHMFSFMWAEPFHFLHTDQLELQIIRQTYLCTNRTSLITPTILTTPHRGQSRNYSHTEQNHYWWSVKDLELKLIRNIVCSQRKHSCSEMDL